MGKGPAKILVVDDEILICELLDEFLSMIGYQVTTTTKGQEAISKFEEINPDVVMLDIKMPKITGIEVLRKIKKINSDTIVIMLSAFGDSNIVRESLQIGANYYMEKPIDLEGLKNILVTLQESKK